MSSSSLTLIPVVDVSLHICAIFTANRTANRDGAEIGRPEGIFSYYGNKSTQRLSHVKTCVRRTRARPCRWAGGLPRGGLVDWSSSRCGLRLDWSTSRDAAMALGGLRRQTDRETDGTISCHGRGSAEQSIFELAIQISHQRDRQTDGVTQRQRE